MANKDKLLGLVKKAQKGDKDAYKRVINELYTEIYNIVGFVVEDEEELPKLTKHLFINAYRKIGRFNEDEMDIHLWIAREATKELYNVLDNREEALFVNEIPEADYPYSSIEEDDELGEASAEFNEEFFYPEGIDKTRRCYTSLSAGEKLLYLMFCYEGYSIQEIEDLIEIDSKFLESEIYAMKPAIVGEYEALTGSRAGSASSDSEEDILMDDVSYEGDFAIGATAQGKSSRKEQYDTRDNDGFGRDDDEDYDEDDDYIDAKPSARRASERPRDKKAYAIGPLKFTEKEFKGIIVGGAAAIILIIVMCIVVWAMKNSDDEPQDATVDNATTTVTELQTPEPTLPTTEEATEATTEATEAPTKKTQVQVITQKTKPVPTTEATQPATTKKQEEATEATQPATTKKQEATTEQKTTKSIEQQLSEYQSMIDAHTTEAPTTEAPTTTQAPTTEAPTTTEPAIEAEAGAGVQNSPAMN